MAAEVYSSLVRFKGVISIYPSIVITKQEPSTEDCLGESGVNSLSDEWS